MMPAVRCSSGPLALRSVRRLVAVGLAAAALVALPGCPAVYPELNTATRKPPAGALVDPPPPDDLHWIRVKAAHIPPHARDGRPWDQVLGSLPDPYAKILVNGKELFRTPVQSDTLEPTWPDAPHGNFKIEPEDKLRVEIWDDSALTDLPIGVRDVGHVPEDARLSHELRVDLDGGADIEIAFEPAHAMLGLGLWYEIRTDSVFVTRVLAESPATRAGVGGGDQVLQLGGRVVAKMAADDVRSTFNAVPVGGLPLVVRHPSGTTENVTLKEGAIYPLFSDFGAID